MRGGKVTPDPNQLAPSVLIREATGSDRVVINEWFDANRLTASDVDRLAEVRGESRLFQQKHPNIHE